VKLQRLAAGLIAAACITSACSSGSGSAPSSVGGSDICGKLAALPCSEYATVADCNAALDAMRQTAQKSGCISKYDAVLDCYGSHPLSCSSNDKMEIDPACGPLLLDYAKCDPDAVCLRSTTTGSCSYACSSSAMSCTDEGSGWSCTCTKGPKANLPFSSAEQTPCSRTVLVANCN
jgi:hypothetical protein